MEKENALKDKSFAFAVRIVNTCRYLRSKHNEYKLSDQLLRSGTVIGALHREAEQAESTPDFIHKLAIAQKECYETMYWLELFHATELIETKSFESIHADACELMRIITAILLTTKTKQLIAKK